jgi:hypothetical protein
MKIQHRKRVIALATIAGTGALVLSAGSAQVATARTFVHTSATSVNAARPTSGLYVTGESAVTTTAKPSAYLVDHGNREHLVTLTANANYPGKDTVAYRTRQLGAKHWTVHSAPTLISATGSPRVEESISPDNGDIEVVVYACDGVYAADAHPSAGRLPEFTTVVSEDNCGSATTTPSADVHMTTVTYNEHDGTDELGVLVPDQGTSGTWDLFEGNPGSTFTDLGPLPTADSFVPAQLVPSTRIVQDATLVGYGVDRSGDEGVFLTTLSWTYNAGWTAVWSDPKEITTLGKTDADYTIESVTAYDPTIDIALYAAPGSFPGQKHTLFVDESESNGQWSGPIALQHTSLHDKNLILVRNLDTGTLHATFQRAITSSKIAKTTKSGIMKEYHLKGNWSTPTFMTHWFKDMPLQASLDTNDKIHVEYLRS